jgi:hypothetical protein
MGGFRLVIFLSVFFILFGLISYYLFIRGWQGIAVLEIPTINNSYIVLFIVFSFSYVLVRFFGKILPTPVGDTLALIGGFWFAAMLYFILFAVFFDLARFIGNTFSLFPPVLVSHFPMVKLYSFLISVVVTISLLTYGYFNAMNPKITKLEININKQVDGMKQLHLVFASDIHLGHVIGKKSIENIIAKINSLNPDIVLFPGDVVDEELYPVVNKKLGEAFTKLNPRFGVYAVTGNHEYIGGVENAVKYLSRHGIKVLRDEAVNINDQFYVVGREDISINSFTSGKRKSLEELVKSVDNNLPVVLMDHQPISLSEASKNEIDLQVSGHTHHGQMWPLNYITENVFKLSWGYRQVKNSHFYVSSGAGIWGPRVRIGNHPEIVSIILHFQ